MEIRSNLVDAMAIIRETEAAAPREEFLNIS